jgi:spermidine synthase
VIWTRMLSLLLGGTVYTFSIILSVFLVGLGIGSSVGSVIARETSRPGLALAICQFLAALSMGWTAYMLSRSVPFWPVNPALTASPWLNFQMDLARCLWATLPAPILWGASFPLALAAVARPGQDPGGVVGKVYAANTVGAILGALGASVLLVGWFGTQRAQQWLMILAGLGTLMMMVVAFRTDPQPLLRVKTMRVIGATGAVALVLAAAGAVPSLPWKLVAFGRYLPTYTDDRLVLFLGEGLVSSVAVTEMQDGVRTFHVSGKVEASSDAQDMRLQRMLGHIPALLHPNPKSVLIVGCGAGVTAGSFTVYPGIERIVICEIEPLIPRHVAPYFGPENYNVVNDPRVEIIHDDARHYILTTKEKFDIITSDPIHPWVKGAATLYTKEYFEMVKKHLKPGGLVTQWVPLYESNLDVVKSEIATFFSVFEDGTIWSNDNQGQGYDTVLLGSAEPISIDLDAIQARMEQTSAVAESLQDVGFWSAMALMATHAGQAADLKQWLADAEINRDRNLRLQFMAGLASTVFQEGTIYDEIISQWGFPDGLFTGPEEAVRELREALERRRGKR